jgi:hypothetical protein
VRIDTKYGIGDWIKFKDTSKSTSYGEVVSIGVYSDRVYYSTLDRSNIQESDILAVRRTEDPK